MTNKVPVEIRPAIDPAGRPGVLLQFSHGWIVLPPAEAERLAQMIIETAQEVRGLRPGSAHLHHHPCL